jgi:hypothetical protein
MMNQLVLRYGLVFSLVVLLGSVRPPNLSAGGQSHCDASLTQLTNNPLGYRDRGDRCEGIYVEQVGSTTLLVASLTESFEEYKTGSGKALDIEWDKPPADGNVRVRAQALKRRLYYRMDTAQPSGRTSYHWPTDILASLKILKNDLGVVALTRYSVGQRDRDVYLPLRIKQAGQVGQATRTGSYKLVLLPGVELEEIFVSLASIGADGHPKKFFKDGEKLGYGYYPAERGVEIPIIGLKEAGTYYLEIGARLRSGGTSTIELWLYYQKG